jgi:hypothetical protein
VIAAPPAENPGRSGGQTAPSAADTAFGVGLRPLARALRTSPRMLLYDFGRAALARFAELTAA